MNFFKNKESLYFRAIFNSLYDKILIKAIRRMGGWVVVTYEYIQNLKTYNQTLKLLGSDHVALNISFFYLAFIKEKNIILKHSQIISLLDDYLFHLNQIYECKKRFKSDTNVGLIRTVVSVLIGQ